MAGIKSKIKSRSPLPWRSASLGSGHHHQHRQQETAAAAADAAATHHTSLASYRSSSVKEPPHTEQQCIIIHYLSINQSINHSLLGSKGFRFWRKSDEMTKTGRRDENIDFWRNLTKLAKFGICGKFFDEICTFWRTKNGILTAKFGGNLEKPLSHV